MVLDPKGVLTIFAAGSTYLNDVIQIDTNPEETKSKGALEKSGHRRNHVCNLFIFASFADQMDFSHVRVRKAFQRNIPCCSYFYAAFGMDISFSFQTHVCKTRHCMVQSKSWDSLLFTKPCLPHPQTKYDARLEFWDSRE